VDTKKKEEYIVLAGDHRDEINQFLIHEGIGTKDNIKIHGAAI
jgi:translation initiation factor 1 (eIF-1/SUI1)